MVDEQYNLAPDEQQPGGLYIYIYKYICIYILYFIKTIDIDRLWVVRMCYTQVMYIYTIAVLYLKKKHMYVKVYLQLGRRCCILQLAQYKYDGLSSVCGCLLPLASLWISMLTMGIDNSAYVCI